MMLLSDVIGGLASLSLVIPPAKDQLFRWRRAGELKKEGQSPWPALRGELAKDWEARRNRFSAMDSMFTIAGGLGLVATFGLKLLGY